MRPREEGGLALPDLRVWRPRADCRSFTAEAPQGVYRKLVFVAEGQGAGPTSPKSAQAAL